MSICGEADGGPTKYGVAIVDVCTGMLACNAILAALNARHRTGKGQKVELSLYETSLAMLVNVAQNYLSAGKRRRPVRQRASEHRAVHDLSGRRRDDRGRGRQRAPVRALLAEVLGHPEWAQDARFNSNRARVENRDVIDGLINAALRIRQGRRLAREARGGRRAVRQDQFGRAGARRSAHAGAPHGRDGRASGHRRLEDARHSVQVFRHRLLGAPRAADARPAHRRDPDAASSASTRNRSQNCARRR